MGFINISNINNTEYDAITKIINNNIENNSTSAKIIVVFCNPQNMIKANKLKNFCKQHDLKLRFIERSEIRKYIFNSFNVGDKTNIDLKKLDIGKLTNNEILYMYANAVKLKSLIDNDDLKIVIYKTSDDELTKQNITFAKKLFKKTKITVTFKSSN